MNPIEKPLNKAGIFKRLAAFGIDSFAVYTVASFLISITALLRIRIAIEPLFIVLYICYGTIMLALRGQTFGKMLLGITITGKSGEKPGLLVSFIREALGKWGITVVIPMLIGRLIVGRGWVPTVYDILILLPPLLILPIYYLIAKRTWYDQLAGTFTVTGPYPVKRWKPALLVLLGATVMGIGTKALEFTSQHYIPCRLSVCRSMRSTEPYKSYLDQGHASPVDYVINLFDRYDVVVLCERPHPEASQWEFICDLVEDERFIRRVGHVFTEYGQMAMQPYMDEFMAADGLDSTGVHDRAVHIMRNMGVWPAWTNTNFYTYLTRLYALNQSLPEHNRIRHHFTDTAVDWSDLTTVEEYRAYMRPPGSRDEQMAKSIIAEMGRLEQSGESHPKALVIMNYRHGFDLTGRDPAVKRFNTYEFLRDAFGDRTANVLLNTRIFFVPAAGALWESSFEETGNHLVGFDFAGTSFGEEPFDMFPFRPQLRSKLRYQDVFTGFVYTQPIGEQYMQYGIPGYYKGFEDEVLRRAKLISEEYPQMMQRSIVAEKEGRSLRREERLDHKMETAIEVFLLSLQFLGVMLILGVLLGIRIFRRKRPDNLRLTET